MAAEAYDAARGRGAQLAVVGRATAPAGRSWSAPWVGERAGLSGHHGEPCGPAVH